MEGIKRILIVAGEASGDLHASNLVRAIKNIYPRIEFFGLGGSHLKETGATLYSDIVKLAVVGFVEVLKNLNKFRKIFKSLLKEIDKTKPDLAILVDYPGFNLRLAEELHKRGIPIVYYISPQIWAWGEKRIVHIKRLIKRMLVIFKFEEELYKTYNVPVSFVGHPLVDIVRSKVSKKDLFSRFGLALDKPAFALLPGSRDKEVKTLLPLMLDTAALIFEQLEGNVQFLILRSETVKEEVFNEIASRYKLAVKIISDMTYDGLSACDFSLIASGTATLEAAILGIPMAIIYKVSFITWLYIKMVIKIPYIGLVNIVKKEKFIPEFIQFNARPRRIADYVIKVWQDKKGLNKIRQGLSQVKEILGENGASRRAAEIIVDLLQ